MAINLNTNPYYDDFDETKNYKKILFKPGLAVQARELTQLQSALQNQISNFGSHVFKEGSIVLGGLFNLEQDVPYISIEETDTDTTDILSYLPGSVFTGAISGVKAYVYLVAKRTDWGYTNHVLMIKYQSSSVDTNEATFTVGETITSTVVINGVAQVVSLTVGTESGLGSTFSVDDGVVFSRGYFVSFTKQTIILDPKSSTPTLKIGFDSAESIVSYTSDNSLLDNSQGSFNYAAPGADRLKIATKLVIVDINDETSLPDYVNLITIREGQIYEYKERTEYARVADELAKRTYDESGDYVVRGFGVRTREHLDNGVNEGFYTIGEGGDFDKLVAEVEPGLAYVKGYEINKLATSRVEIDKSSTTKSVNGELLTVRSGSYVKVTSMVGSLTCGNGSSVDLYDATGGTGTKIGSALVKSYEYVSGTGTNKIYHIYLYKISIDSGAGTFSDVVSIKQGLGGLSGGCHADLTIQGKLYDTNSSNLLLSVPSNSVKQIASTAGPNVFDTIFTYRTSVQGTLSTGSITVTASGGEEIAYGVGVLGDVERQKIIVSLIDDATFAGTVIDSTNFVATVNSTTSMTISGLGAYSGDVRVTYDIKRDSAAPGAKTVQKSRFIKFNLTGWTSGQLASPISIGVSDVYQIKSIRKKSGSDFSSASDGTDVTQDFLINKGQTDDVVGHCTIRSFNLASGDRLLVELDYFVNTFTNGYGYMSVDSYPVNDEPGPAEVDTTIYTYEIPSYKSPITGDTYSLRNYLDFRPIETNTTTPNSFASAPVLTSSATAGSLVNVTKIPTIGSNVYVDYLFYLARRDVLVLDSYGNFTTVTGNPAVYPVTPNIPEDTMGVAKLYIPPYPSLSSSLTRILGLPVSSGTGIESITNKRYTMRDIGVIKQRVDNIEYYASLNTLEKNTKDLLFLDENGLDRFKNGFFVDPFVDHSLGQTTRFDYKIAVDKKDQVIRPIFELDSFAYDRDPISTSNLRDTNGLVTLDYTETLYQEQPRITTFRNIEYSVFRYIGTTTLTPSIDTWVDTTTVDVNITLGDERSVGTVMSTEWGSWQTYVTGTPVTVYNVYTREYGDRDLIINSSNKLVGSYTSYADAQKAARGAYRAYIETVTSTNKQYSSSRSGVQNVITTEKNTEQTGDLVKDVSVIPYIRPQIINIQCKGLKPNTEFFVFFDEEDMTGYSALVYNGTILAESASKISNEDGTIEILLRLPTEGKRFRVGTKDVIITDSPTNATEATSYAKSYFVASGLAVQKQNTIISTYSTTTVENPVVERNAVNTYSGNRKVEVFGPSCMAYSLKVEAPPGSAGLFLTGADVYIKQVHPTLGVWFEIREMTADGGITRTQVPYSEVWYTSDEVVTTPSGANPLDHPHRVTFPSPVFLMNDTQYAFVIHTEGLNPDTYFWISKLGETDVVTNNAVTSRRLTGNVYTTNNNMNWALVPDIDLTVKFYRASFAYETPGVLTMGNEPHEFLNLTGTDNDANAFKIIGEEIEGSQALTLTGITGTISVGNTLTTSSGSATVTAISGNIYYTDGFDFAMSSTAVSSSSGATATMTSIIQGTGTLHKHYYYPLDFYADMTIRNSNGQFFETGLVRGVISGKEGTISSITSLPYSVVHLKPRTVVLTGTTCDYQLKSTPSSSYTLSSWTDCIPNYDFNFSDEKALKSRSLEVSQMSGQKSSQLKATVTSDSNWVSPIIDMNLSNAIFVRNIINNDVSEETNPYGGNLINKYISKIITLAEGQDAEDVVIRLSAYRPQNSDIKVWIQFRNNEDGGDLVSNKDWVELETTSDLYSSSENPNDFVELEYVVPEANKLNGIIKYEYDGNTYSTFRQLVIKIGLAGTNSAIVPKVSDLQAIALQL